MTRAALSQARATIGRFTDPVTFWPHAFHAAIYTYNRLPRRSSGDRVESPWQLLTGQLPDYKALRAWGSLVWMTQEPSPSGLTARGLPCLYLGPEGHSTQTRVLWNPALGVSVHALRVSRDVAFDERSLVDPGYILPLSLRSLPAYRPMAAEPSTSAPPTLPASLGLPVRSRGRSRTARPSTSSAAPVVPSAAVPVAPSAVLSVPSQLPVFRATAISPSRLIPAIPVPPYPLASFSPSPVPIIRAVALVSPPNAPAPLVLPGVPPPLVLPSAPPPSAPPSELSRVSPPLVLPASVPLPSVWPSASRMPSVPPSLVLPVSLPSVLPLAPTPFTSPPSAPPRAPAPLVSPPPAPPPSAPAPFASPPSASPRAPAPFVSPPRPAPPPPAPPLASPPPAPPRAHAPPPPPASLTVRPGHVLSSPVRPGVSYARATAGASPPRPPPVPPPAPASLPVRLAFSSPVRPGVSYARATASPSPHRPPPSVASAPVFIHPVTLPPASVAPAPVSALAPVPVPARPVNPVPGPTPTSFGTHRWSYTLRHPDSPLCRSSSFAPPPFPSHSLYRSLLPSRIPSVAHTRQSAGEWYSYAFDFAPADEEAIALAADLDESAAECRASRAGSALPDVVNASALPVEPATAAAAYADPAWRVAMQIEYDAHIRNGTWELVPLPPGRRALPSRWVFKTKSTAAGTLDKLKARFVCCGYAQRAGVDYYHTYAPVARTSSLRLLLSLAASRSLRCRHLDVVSAFLQGAIDADVYVQQPTYFEQYGPNGEQLVCHLRRSLYGLKQAPRVWNLRLHDALTALGFIRTKSDPGVYRLQSANDDDEAYILVHVDDIALFASSPALESSIVAELGRSLEIQDRGPLTFFLGFEIALDSRCVPYFISQRKNASDVLLRFNMERCNPVSTPAALGADLSKRRPDEPECSVGMPLYRELIGSLQYLCNTRLELLFPVSLLARHVQAPAERHWKAALRVLRYIRGTLDYGIHLRAGDPTVVSAMSDADWAGDTDTRKSTSGYICYVAGNPVSAASHYQRTVTALSTCEAELIASSEAIQELLALRNLLSELSFDPRPSRLAIDNLGTIDILNDPLHTGRLKHVDIRTHFVRDHVDAGTIRVHPVPSADNAADIFTKVLGPDKFLQHRSALRIGPCPESSPQGGGDDTVHLCVAHSTPAWSA